MIKTQTLLIVCLCCHFIISAQDTLYLKTKQKEIGKVTEVGPDYVKYTRLGFKDSPVFTRLQNELDSVRFGNGEVIRFNRIYLEQPAVTTSERKYPLIEKEGGRYFYEGRVLSEKRLKDLILHYPRAEHKQMLLTEFEKVRSLKKQQHLWGTIGPVIAGSLVMFGLIYSLEKENFAYFGLGLVGGSLSLGAGLSAAQFLKKKRSKQFVNVVKYYNAFLQ